VSAYQLKIGQVDGRGNYWENVLHFTNSETAVTAPYAAALDLVNSFASDVLSHFLNLLGTDVKVNILSCKKIDGTGGPTAFAQINASGTGSTPSVSPAYAADIQVIPGGLKNRPGHIFVAGIPNAALVGSVYQAAFETACTGFFTALFGLETTTGGNDVNYGTYTKSTKTVTVATNLLLNVKVTALNKRTLPLT
jgi:hypothetical protein